MEVMWNPWHGCHKCSEGCRNCYVYAQDMQYGRNSNIVVKSKTNFWLPIQRGSDGMYKLKAGTKVHTCYTSDFFIEEACAWRPQAWEMIRTREDLMFYIPTKRIHRWDTCLPDDWYDGYPNVCLIVSCENQKAADDRISTLIGIPAFKRGVYISPILEYVNIKKFASIDKIDFVSVGGESYKGARVSNFDWVRQIKWDCDNLGIEFNYHQTGAKLIVDGKLYNIPRSKEKSQAAKAMERLK